MKNFNKKEWEFALPDADSTFKAMSDVLYTYLYSISKHNPTKRQGQYVEDWNYIYLDKGPNGEPKYSPTLAMQKTGIARATYYRKLNKLKELELIEEVNYGGRRILKLPFISSDRIINVKTSKFFSESFDKMGFTPEDIVKIMVIMKCYYYSDNKSFSVADVKKALGYSLKNNDKNCYVIYLIDVLHGLDVIDYTTEIKKKGEVEWILFTLTDFDDSYNEKMQAYDKSKEAITIETREDIEKIKAAAQSK